MAASARGVKADADGIAHAPNSDQKRCQSVYRAKHGSHPQQDYPAKGQVGNDRTWLDATWTAQLYGGSSDCSRPNRGGHPDRPNAVQSACREWRVGTGDHQKDRDMIKLAEKPSSGCIGGEVVGCRAAEHREKASGIDEACQEIGRSATPAAMPTSMTEPTTPAKLPMVYMIRSAASSPPRYCVNPVANSGAW
jgi:hypothetical protein